jgi:hypothetical protein
MSSSLYAFLAPFVGGLVVLSLAFFVLAPYASGPGDFIMSFLLVPAIVGIPWGVYNLLSAAVIRAALNWLRPQKLRWFLIIGFACSLVLATAGVYLILQEQKDCDRVCLGLEQKVLGTMPLYAVTVALLSFVGVVQAFVYKRLLDTRSVK